MRLTQTESHLLNPEESDHTFLITVLFTLFMLGALITCAAVVYKTDPRPVSGSDMCAAKQAAWLSGPITQYEDESGEWVQRAVASQCKSASVVSYYTGEN